MFIIFTNIKAALNQRPLTYLGSDPKNPQANTPSHLVIGRALQTIPFVSSDPNYMFQIATNIFENDGQMSICSP